jgi:predicted 2-oxoglutarate/Fe(II)-dependent dioxygenase YbiX
MLKQSILFSKEECDYIIGLKNKYPLLGENGRWDDFDDFRYKFYALEYPNDIDWIIQKMCDYFEKEMNLHIFHRPTKLNLHHYTEGDEFGKHIDTGTPIKEWNVGIILNEDFAGGDYLVFNENDEPIVIDKKIGNVCVYQSQTPHQVTPITKGERWAIAMFIHKFRMNTVRNML